jgi:hypothetical protein
MPPRGTSCAAVAPWGQKIDLKRGQISVKRSCVVQNGTGRLVASQFGGMVDNGQPQGTWVDSKDGVLAPWLPACTVGLEG